MQCDAIIYDIIVIMQTLMSVESIHFHNSYWGVALHGCDGERLDKRTQSSLFKPVNAKGARLREQTWLRKEFGKARNLLLFIGRYQEVTV